MPRILPVISNVRCCLKLLENVVYINGIFITGISSFLHQAKTEMTISVTFHFF